MCECIFSINQDMKNIHLTDRAHRNKEMNYKCLGNKMERVTRNIYGMTMINTEIRKSLFFF